MKHNKTCIVCGTKYQYCPSCSEYAHLAPWHNLYHDENCREIFQVVSGYLQGYISKEDAKARLQQCNLSIKDKCKSSIVLAIKEIMTEEKTVEEVVEDLHTEEYADTQIDTIVESTEPVQAKSLKKRKKELVE